MFDYFSQKDDIVSQYDVNPALTGALKPTLRQSSTSSKFGFQAAEPPALKTPAHKHNQPSKKNVRFTQNTSDTENEDEDENQLCQANEENDKAHVRYNELSEPLINSILG